MTMMLKISPAPEKILSSDKKTAEFAYFYNMLIVSVL